MAKGIVRVGFMAGANFYIDNAETPPYLKKGASGRKFPLNRDTVANIEVANARGRREKMSVVTRGTDESTAGMMSNKGYIMIFITLKNDASFMGEIDKEIFQGLRIHSIEWGAGGVDILEGIIDEYAKGINSKKKRENTAESESNLPEVTAKHDPTYDKNLKRTKDTESKMLEVRAKYGAGYDKAMMALKSALLSMVLGWVLLAATERFVVVGGILVLLSLSLSIYALALLCWGRYKASKG